MCFLKHTTVTGTRREVACTCQRGWEQAWEPGRARHRRTGSAKGHMLTLCQPPFLYTHLRNGKEAYDLTHGFCEHWMRDVWNACVSQPQGNRSVYVDFASNISKTASSKLIHILPLQIWKQWLRGAKTVFKVTQEGADSWPSPRRGHLRSLNLPHLTNACALARMPP